MNKLLLAAAALSFALVAASAGRADAYVYQKITWTFDDGGKTGGDDDDGCQQVCTYDEMGDETCSCE